MSTYPYRDIAVTWVRPEIDRELLKSVTKRSDVNGLFHALGTIAVLAASGYATYSFYAAEQWLLMAVGLYVHGGLFAFRPQVHELSHNTVFRMRWLNRLFARVFGLIHWNSNHVRYWMSHKFHHRYTLHRESEAERTVPRPQTWQSLLVRAVHVVDITGFITTMYDTITIIIRPFLRNSRRSVWERYVYNRATPAERRSAYITHLYQVLVHGGFAVWAIASGNWFLIVVVTLPHWYGAHWYHTLIHDTMHVGRTPESDDFRESCRSVRLDPISSFLYWHMEWHAEHHTFAAVPCYNLRRFHRLTREYWEKPQSLFQAWREMTEKSLPLLSIEPARSERGPQESTQSWRGPGTEITDT